ncbi:TonB-linked outer membrane protein, SusC/RagA family [Pedobacter westerhofensis]|uniref:TonB-linked outer membrane protein, SusC/RagA family n=1 Tax=Pedobacter westerhofensis TaxID=425512 RepID=A0A521FKV8_9SPHI|nr:TonB-dependent receptor [Pedobacter westerhofensis]SMO96759.1 TonB-linked outer membrane protein, SusC/RagA family [Pedobacter westerhofensis]
MKRFLPDERFINRIAGFFMLLTVMFAISSESLAGQLTASGAPKLYHSAIQQDLTVKGKVTDGSTGQSLPDVTVQIKGSTIRTVTDANGNFAIRAQENATLVFLFVGYDASEVAVKGTNFLNVTLRAKPNSLNELVVVGYGTQKKTSTTAAVSSIQTSLITQKPIVNITNGLVGRAAGLIATQGGGEPGFDGSGLLIRGPATTGRTQPLTVVDGVPRDFSRLDPNSIETITILKDAAAVAPYGVAGANGVILITTKSGKSGKPTLTYNGYYGFQNPTNVPRFVNSYQYALLRNEAAVNDGTAKPYTQTDIDLYQNHLDPDGHADGRPLEDIIMKNRPIQYHNITMSGGSEDVKYFASLGYNRQDGMWSTTYLQKYNGSLGVTANATKTTTVNLRVNSYQEDQHFPAIGAGSIIGQAQRQNPTYPVRYSNGLAAGYIGQSLYSQIYDSGYTLNKNTAWLTQLSIEQKLPLKGLSLKGIVSYDIGPDPLGFSGNDNSQTRTWQTPMPFTNPVSPNGVFAPGTVYTFPLSKAGVNQPRLSQTSNENKMMTLQGLLNYNNTFGKSQLTGTLVTEYRKVRWQNFTASRINYNLSIDELNFGGPLPTDVIVSGSSGGQKQLGYVYRFTYAYNNRYLFETAGRYDGSYIFSPGNRFGFFPSFSAGWRISEESFMKSIKWIDNLKLRGSYGQSGNYPSGGQYQYLSQFGINNNSAVIGGNATQSISENLQGNPNITWERAKKTDIALEGTLFNGLLSFETDLFYEKRSNFLVTIGTVLPAEYGVGTGQVNGGVLKNQGVEFTLSSFKNFANGMRLDLRGTFTYAKSTILQVYENPATFNNPNRRQTGRPLGEQFGLKALGYYTPDDFINPTAQNPTLKPGVPIPNFGQVHVGDLKYADLSSPDGTPDGKVDANDITDIGHPQTPQIQFGLEPRISFKNFDLDLLFQGSARSNIQLNNYYVFPFLGSGSATEAVFNDHWTPDNLNATYPRISGTPSANNTQTSSWYIRNDSYIRLKSAELGYTIPRRILGKSISSVRVFASGQNLFTVTPHMKEAIDPENSGSNQNYYQQRVISFGLNVTF